MWNDLEMEIEICSKCALERVRKNPVAGKGNKEAKILFVMDSISTEEDNRNELLTDKNGEYFMKFLEYAKLNLKKLIVSRFMNVPPYFFYGFLT